MALGRNDTRWTMDQGYQIDYYVTVDDGPAEILDAIRSAMHEFTGGAPAADDRTAVILKRLT